MNGSSKAFLAIALAALLASSGVAGAQSANESGDENEFGALSSPFQVEVQGQELILEARIVLKEHYEEQTTTWFIFAVTTEDSPALYADIVSLRTADGEDLTVYKKEGVGTPMEQWLVDVDDMPGTGTEMVLEYKLGATQRGVFSIGSMIVPFNHRWEQVDMSDGDQARLYGYTQVGVNKETGTGGGFGFKSPFGGDGDSRFPVPGPAAVLALVGIGLAALVAGDRARGGRR